VTLRKDVLFASKFTGGRPDVVVREKGAKS